MKKRVCSMMLAGMLTLSLAANGTNAFADQNKTVSPETEAATSLQPVSSDRTLIVYFSPSNSDTVDSVTGATTRVGDVSAVEYVASTIGNTVDADMAKIVPDIAYPVVYDDVADRAESERDNNERPGFSLDVNPEEYDTILVGYPIWWYGLPMVMETFFDTYDFSGKTIIPFNTHYGSGNGGTYADIEKLEPEATVLDGIAISINDVADSEKDVNEWLAGLGY